MTSAIEWKNEIERLVGPWKQRFLKWVGHSTIASLCGIAVANVLSDPTTGLDIGVLVIPHRAVQVASAIAAGLAVLLSTKQLPPVPQWYTEPRKLYHPAAMEVIAALDHLTEAQVAELRRCALLYLAPMDDDGWSGSASKQLNVACSAFARVVSGDLGTEAV